jgi:hypothetical protein
MLFQLHPSALKQKDAKRICPSLLQQNVSDAVGDIQI